MGIINWLKRVWDKLFKKEIETQFGAEIQLSTVMEQKIQEYHNITSGKPPWLDLSDDIETINFAGFIDDVTAGLVTLDIGVEFPDTPRGEYLKSQWNYVSQVLQDKVSEGLGNCGIMLKPNGKNVDYIEAGYFVPTETDSNDNILGCIFISRIDRGKYTYHKFEWQRFEDRVSEQGEAARVYVISNVAFKKRLDETNAVAINTEDAGEKADLNEVAEWANLAPEMVILGVEKPLFTYFKNPAPNRIDRTSALGVPLWNNAVKELKDLDVAWSRKGTEVEDSKHITFTDISAIRYASENGTKLARFVKGMDMGANAVDGTPIHEHVATMLTEQRIADINSTLAMISTKCGYSQGMFVLDEKSGVVTATQIESDDQETIRTVKNIRDALQDTLNNLFYALNVMADIYTTLPAEQWDMLKEDIVYNFADITANADEDRARALLLTKDGFYPKWYYLVNYEGISKDKAKELLAEVEQPQDSSLFDEE